MKPALVLVDASVYIFRAWFALPESITNAEGEPTNAVTGFIRFLQSMHHRARQEHKAEHYAINFDESLSSSFRNKLYPPYKANREKAPANLKWQMKQCQQAAKAMGFATFASKRYEADDLIATIARQMRPAEFRVIVVSSDKDLAQVIERQDLLWDFARDEKLGVSGIREKLGVRPGQIPDWLGLSGDAVDNIPGVPGVGKKTAVQLLSHFRDIDHLYDKIDKIDQLPLRGSKTLREKLVDFEDQARLSRQLATVHDKIPLQCDDKRVLKTRPRPRLVNQVVRELGLSERARERMLNMN